MSIATLIEQTVCRALLDVYRERIKLPWLPLPIREQSIPAERADVETILRKALSTATERLTDLMEPAFVRLVDASGQADHFFNDAERDELVEVLASIRAVSDLLARSLIRDQQQQVLDAAAGERQESVLRGHLLESVLREDIRGVPMLPPEKALEYFRSLVPTLGTDPLRFGETMRRSAFTMAAATDEHLLARVQSLITDRLRTGEALRASTQEIQALMDAAGVSPANPQYAEAVMRTNVMDAYNTAAEDELADPDVMDTFPVWQYSNPVDQRSRAEHAARDGRYYPSSVRFSEVRGTDAGNVINCRCTPIPISKFEWRRLKAAGARIADGYQDVAA